MELAEVMSKAERDAQERGDETSKKKGAASSKAYVLRSILAPSLIEGANTFDEEIRLEENNHPRLQNRNKDDYELDNGNGGCILAWQFFDHLGAMGFLSVVLALILVNGKEVQNSMIMFSSVMLSSVDHLKWCSVDISEHLDFRKARRPLSSRP